MIRVILLFVFTICMSLMLTSCKKEKPNPEENFYEKLFSYIEQNSIKKNEINWVDLKKKVKDSIDVFNNMDDVYRATRYTLKLVNDSHSKLLTRLVDSNGNPKIVKIDSMTLIETRIIDGDIGYIALYGFSSDNESLSDYYRKAVRNALLLLDSTTKLSGWVIDLRNNSGGDPTCETLGLSPLFEQPLIGLMCDNRKTFQKVVCSKSIISFGNGIMDTLICDSTLMNNHKKIALLVGKKTASAAEFLALAFKFQDNTRLIGSKTYGATSNLVTRNITDTVQIVVAKLYLATRYFCDRNKNLYTGGIKPDIDCDDSKCIPMAVNWIKQP